MLNLEEKHLQLTYMYIVQVMLSKAKVCLIIEIQISCTSGKFFYMYIVQDDETKIKPQVNGKILEMLQSILSF